MRQTDERDYSGTFKLRAKFKLKATESYWKRHVDEQNQFQNYTPILLRL